jgi:hypothetical protein
MVRRLGYIPLFFILVSLCAAKVALASEYRGQVTFGGLPVPGATVTATQGDKKFTAVSDQGGAYDFPDLPDGAWKIDVEMQCFSTIHSDVTISASMPAGKWELTLQPADQLLAASKLAPPPPVAPAAQPALVAPAPATKKAATSATAAAVPDAPKPTEQQSQDSSDGFLVNGSSNNAATSQYSLDQAFGNRRPNSRSLYNGGIAVIFDNSALDARQYALAGVEQAKPLTDRITGIASFRGPLNIRHVQRGLNFYTEYRWVRNQTAQTSSGIVPTSDERNGDLSSLPETIYNPATGLPFSGNQVPVSPQAQALLAHYPLPTPNFVGTSGYNYQATQVTSNHQDAVQARINNLTLGSKAKDHLNGVFSLTSTRASSENLFGFVDTTDSLGDNANVNWSHRFNPHLYLNALYNFSRTRTLVTPQFANNENIEGEAGISGGDQTPTYWGPPALNFSSISPLSDGPPQFNRARTDLFTGTVAIYHGRHNIALGGDFRVQQFNNFNQANPRGSFTFTGAATTGAGSSGSDFADFLLGIPDASSISFANSNSLDFGNGDKYFRQKVYDAYANDDWRILSVLTINAGIRWDYGAPMTETQGRLANLDIASGFTAAAPVLGNNPVGPLTGIHYPSSLIRPDLKGFEPSIGVAWRPIPASTVVVRAGYGLNVDTSVYQTFVPLLSQQQPFSSSVSVQNSAACPLTLANGFPTCSTVTPDTFAIDPNFRIGYAQNWKLTVQRDLPMALQMTATYLGTKGTHGAQQILPNTYPIGEANPCPSCPLGFQYRTSGGNLTREAGSLQLRRRLRNGFTATLTYTYAKSIDDYASIGGQGHVTAGSSGSTGSTGIAQNWLAPQAERSLSSGDQRHLLNVTGQYTSGEGLGGGDLMGGWPGRILKEWTVLTTVAYGTGMPETPIYPGVVTGTSVQAIRPDLTGASIYAAPAGYHLNAAAFTAPVAGQWGTAGRDSITGPDQFTVSSSLQRTFRPTQKYYIDARIDATNPLNHAVYTNWNPAWTPNSTFFGLPTSTNPMRSLTTTISLRF